MTLRFIALVAALSLGAFHGSAAAQTIDPGPIIIDPPQPTVRACSQIASFAPASARPGEEVDVYLRPPTGLTIAYSVVGVQFANGVAASFTNVAANHVRARVPLGATTGPITVTCRSLLNFTWSISSATAFTPISFGLALSPSSTTLQVGASTTVTATLSHPAPAPLTLNIAPSAGLSVNSATVTIPAGSRTASFNVTARAPGAATVAVSGPNVTSSTLTVNVPTPGFGLSVTNADAQVQWGDAASYSVQVSSVNGFSGVVELSASGLPFGATAADVNVNVPANGSATATFSVATAQSATELGSDSFTLRGENPNASDRTRSLSIRVLPDAGNFTSLGWRSTTSTCGSLSATVNGANVTFTGPGIGQQSHPLLSYAWTPSCRGAVVLGPSAGLNAGHPASIFNFGFDIPSGANPGQRLNLGTAAWNTGHFRVSPDGSFLIGVAQGMDFSANLYDMVELAQRPPADHYSLAHTIGTPVMGEKVHVDPTGINDDWDWNLPN